MIETVAIPVLLKAVDFLFGEGSKILQERRKRHQVKNDSDHQLVNQPPTSVQTTEDKSVIKTRDDALRQSVQESLWLKSEEKVRHLLSVLDIYTKNYYLAQEKYAKWSSSLVPPIIVHELSESEDKIAETMEELRVTLSRVYQKAVVEGKPEFE